MSKPMLTDAQAFALRWIDECPVSSSAWLRDGNPAYGPPDKWNQFRLAGSLGSIIIPVDDWEVIRQFLDTAPYQDGGSPWKVNADGRKALWDRKVEAT